MDVQKEAEWMSLKYHPHPSPKWQIYFVSQWLSSNSESGGKNTQSEFIPA